MKFTTLLTNLIVEDSRTQFLHDKYVYEPKKGEKPEPNKKGVPYKIFKEIVKADPTTKFPQGFDFDEASYEELKDKVNAGKFTEWILKSLFNLKPDDENVQKGSAEYKQEMAEKVRLFMEDLFKVNGDLVKFVKYQKYFPTDKRDINKQCVNFFIKSKSTLASIAGLKEKLPQLGSLIKSVVALSIAIIDFFVLPSTLTTFSIDWIIDV